MVQGWGGQYQGPFYLPPFNHPPHIWIQCRNRALRPGRQLKGGCLCAEGFFTKHQECCCICCQQLWMLGLCVVDGGWGERWGGGAKKLPIFGLFFPVQLTARPRSNRRTERQLGTEVKSRQQPGNTMGDQKQVSVLNRLNALDMMLSKIKYSYNCDITK